MVLDIGAKIRIIESAETTSKKVVKMENRVSFKSDKIFPAPPATTASSQQRTVFPAGGVLFNTRLVAGVSL